MGDIETLGIIDEIQALVSDKLQVVSYKWLSRNFSVSSNAAKRLLAEFVEKHGNELEVVYTLSGWLKNNPSVYHIKLVARPKLTEAKDDFDGNCSVQVYSVQTCIPKDPAALWNSEFVQAEELFKQPQTVDNCLRDNRFCGVLNLYVHRKTDGVLLSNAVSQAKVAGLSGSSLKIPPRESPNISKPKQMEVEQSNNNINSEDKESAPQLPPDKKKGQNGKSSTGSGSSLATMWGRASTKPKSSLVLDSKMSIPISTVSAEAQISVTEAVEDENSDDDVNFKRTSNGEGSSRKRRVIFDYSDEEDEFELAVNLSSPIPPKQVVKSSLDSKQAEKFPVVLEKSKLEFVEEQEDKPAKVKIESNQSLKEESSVLNKGKSDVVSSSDKTNINKPVLKNDESQKEKLLNAAQNSPKRRKVLKTRIDERGREVTEVVWEGEDNETKSDGDAPKKVDSITIKPTENRAPVAKKSPAIGGAAPIGKGGNKKAGAKDPKQGNILSFFKKV